MVPSTDEPVGGVREETELMEGRREELCGRRDAGGEYTGSVGSEPSVYKRGDPGEMLAPVFFKVFGGNCHQSHLAFPLGLCLVIF